MAKAHGGEPWLGKPPSFSFFLFRSVSPSLTSFVPFSNPSSPTVSGDDESPARHGRSRTSLGESLLPIHTRFWSVLCELKRRAELGFKIFGQFYDEQ